MPKLPRTTLRSVYIIFKITFGLNNIRMIFNYNIFFRTAFKNNIHIFIILNELHKY